MENKTDSAAIPSLKRIIGLASSLLLVAGIMIGTGVFKKIAPMAASGLSSSGILFAWLAAGIITIFGALSASALSELTTESGGEYEYIRLAFGQLPAFLFGWSCFTVIGSASVAAMSHLFASSLAALFPSLPMLQTNVALQSIACVIIILLTLLNCIGTGISMMVNNWLTFVKIAGLLFIIIGAVLLFQSGEISGSVAMEASSNTNNKAWFSMFFAAMLSAFWAYDGWLSVAFMTGEIKDPQKNIPRAIVGGIALVTVVYVLVNWAFMKVLPLSELAGFTDRQIAATGVSEKIFGNYGSLLIALLVLVSALGSLNGIIATYSRMYYKMAQDGFFFKIAGNIGSRSHTPHGALLLSSIVSCILVFSGGFDMLTNMIVFAGFVFYCMLAWGVLILKKKGKISAVNIGYPFVPVLFIVFSIVLMIHTLVSEPQNTGFGLLLMFSGLPFYLWFRSTNNKG